MSRSLGESLLEHDPRMLLRPQHFAARRINWSDKAQSLREIAEELNIGLDAIAFIDDSPVERDRVRRALPEVSVIELRGDATRRARPERRAGQRSAEGKPVHARSMQPTRPGRATPQLPWPEPASTLSREPSRGCCCTVRRTVRMATHSEPSLGSGIGHSLGNIHLLGRAA